MFVCIVLSLSLFSLKCISLWAFEAFRTMNLFRSQKSHFLFLRHLTLTQIALYRPNIKMRDASVRQHVTAVTNRAVVEKSHHCPLNWPGLKSVAVWRIVFSHHYFSLTLWRQQRERAPGTVERFGQWWLDVTSNLKLNYLVVLLQALVFFASLSLISKVSITSPNFMIRQSRIA